MVAAASSCVVACGSKPPKPAPPPKPALLSVELLATGTVNPDGRGRPSPVMVRLYELRSPSGFEAADFVSLYDQDQSVLGADVVARDEFVLAPGEQRSILRPATSARFIAVMAAFRDLERSRWRVATAIRPDDSNACLVRIEGTEVFLGAR